MLQATYRIVAPAGKRGEVVAVLLGLKGPAEVSRGCVACQLYQDLEDPNALTCIQQWDTRENLESHLRSERFRRLIPYIETSVEKPEVAFSAIRKIQGIGFLTAILSS
jgi:quinol monooxygenase YgiN